MEAESSPPPVEASSKIPKLSAQPKKGILKRSGSVNTPKRALGDLALRGPIEALNLSTDSAGHLSPRLSSAVSASKIPKLSVTWWETSSAYGGDSSFSRHRRAKSTTPPRNFVAPPIFAFEAPPHRQTVDAEDADVDIDASCDDFESVTSGGGGSIAGTWWFGKDTRFVPHCSKRGHSHNGEDANIDVDQYLTPTQRKNREIVELKKRLKTALRSLDEKTALVEQLKAQSGISLDGDNDSVSTTVMLENRKLQQKLASVCEEYETKLKKIREEQQRQSAEHEEGLLVQLDQLKQKLSSVDRKKIDTSVTSDCRTQVDAMTLTDVDLTYPNIFAAQNQQELDVCRYENDFLRHKVGELEFLVKNYESELSGAAPSVDGFVGSTCTSGTCAAWTRGLHSQIEAYKNECYVWRTRASELQIAAKQQNVELCDVKQRLADVEQPATPSPAMAMLSMNGPTTMATPPPISAPSFDKKSCKEHTETIKRLEFELDESRRTIKALKRENDGLKEEVGESHAHCDQLNADCGDQATKITALVDQLENLRSTLSENDEILRASEFSLHNVDEQLTNKRAELEVTQLGCQKLRCENEKLENEKAKLEDQLSAAQAAMAQCGISFGAPSSRRRGSRAASQFQIVFRAQEAQTDLKFEDQVRIEADLKEVSGQYEILKERNGSQIFDLENRLAEMSTNLVLKNNLVNTLTNQLQLIQDELASLHSGIERERKSFVEKLHEINLIAQRVPFLESDVNTAREEIRLLEKEYSKEKQKFEKVLESAAIDTLKSQSDTSAHFKQRLVDLQRELEICQKRLREAEQVASDSRMRSTLERVELEKKLQFNLHELDRLQGKVFADRQHFEVQVQPEVCEKSVLCSVCQIEKQTEIGKEDFYDERTGQMKVLQGELQMTRRQVEVLQEKLLVVNKSQQEFAELEQKNSALSSKCAELEKACEELDAKRLMERLDFDAKYESLVEENERMAVEEEEKYHQLESEFENVRLEMEQIINQYEARKAEMKLKLDSLVNEKEDKRRTNEELAELQKTLDSLETSFEREKTILLKKERELEALRMQMTSNKRSSKGSLSSTESLRQRLGRMPANIKELPETEILNDNVSASSAATVSLTDNVHVLAYSKLSKNMHSENSLANKSSSASYSMVTAQDSSSVFELGEKSSQTLDSGGLPTAASTSGALAVSIRQQTHLLQNLRSELQNEQRQRHDAKQCLYERMQKLTRDKTPSSLSRYSSNASLKEALENFTEAQRDSLNDKHLHSPTTLLDMKAKILFLLHENQELNQNMREIKRSVGDFVERRRSFLLASEQASKTTSSESSYKSALETTGPENQNFAVGACSTISCHDLRSMREDLERIALRFNLAEMHKSATTGDLTGNEKPLPRDDETYLIKWLKSEMNREKCELDVMVKWYETDKNRLELDLTEIRLNLENCQCENQFLRRKLEAKERDFKDVAVELSFYKAEDGRKAAGLLGAEMPLIRRYRSDGALCQAPPPPVALVDRLRRATGDLFGLERQFERMERERVQLARQLDLLRGEFVLYKIGHEAQQDEAAYELSISGSMVEISKKDFDAMKRQLHKAEQSAARLDSEATYWQTQISDLRQQARLTVLYKSDAIDTLRLQIDELNDKLLSTKRAKDQLHVECKSHAGQWANQLTSAEQKSHLLEAESIKFNSLATDLNRGLLLTARKQRDVMRRQQSALERAAVELRRLADVEAGGAEAVVELLRAVDEQMREIHRLESELESTKTSFVGRRSEEGLATLLTGDVSDQAVQEPRSTALTVDELKEVEEAPPAALKNRLEASTSKFHQSMLRDSAPQIEGCLDGEGRLVERLKGLRSEYESEIDQLRSSLLRTTSALDVNAQSTDVEDALRTVDQLHAKLAALTLEMERRELKHRHFYDLMYRRGWQDALHVSGGALDALTVVKVSNLVGDAQASVDGNALNVDVGTSESRATVALASSSTCSSEWTYEKGAVDAQKSSGPGFTDLAQYSDVGRADVHAPHIARAVLTAIHRPSSSPDGLPSSADGSASPSPPPPCPSVHHRVAATATPSVQPAAISTLSSAALDQSASAPHISTTTPPLKKTSIDRADDGANFSESPGAVTLTPPMTLSPTATEKLAIFSALDVKSLTPYDPAMLTMTSSKMEKFFPPPPPCHVTRKKAPADLRLNEDEVRLRFLRDSVFYYLMGRDTSDHLQAIMGILKFTEKQRHDVLAVKNLS